MTSAREPHFNGPDYRPARDFDRLTTQLEKVRAFVSDARWHTLDEIAKATGAPHASVSAQLRHLRKPRFGGYTMERRYIKDGLYEYRVLGIERTVQGALFN